MSVAEEIVWPRNDYSRVPFRLYHDRDIFEREMERIFRGPAWGAPRARGRSSQRRRLPCGMARRYAR